MQRVEAERNSGAERKRKVLADVIVGGAVAHLHGVVRHRVEDLKRRHDLARTVHADLEFLVRQIADRLRKILAGAVERIERLRKGCGQAPAQGGGGLGDGGCGDGGGGDTSTGNLEELPAVHVSLLA
jgi:hypothetical protein